MNQPLSGLIAILRGVPAEEAVSVARTVCEAGFHAVEVPLNSPDPFRSISLIREALPSGCRVGAGTVTTADDVQRAFDAGSDLIVSPNTNTTVIRETVRLGMMSYPGVATPTEAFVALEAGARSLKLFPSFSIRTSGMKAWASVLPADVEMLPVGGVEIENLKEWMEAGAAGAGIGSSLYTPGRSLDEIGGTAEKFTRIWADSLSESS